MAEDHKIIALMKKLAGGTMAENVTDEMFIDEFVHLNPAERAEALLKIDEHFGDANDLRQEAQLMNLRRGFRETDQRMRRVGR